MLENALKKFGTSKLQAIKARMTAGLELKSRISFMENELGIPSRRVPFKLELLQARHDELESLLSQSQGVMGSSDEIRGMLLFDPNVEQVALQPKFSPSATPALFSHPRPVTPVAAPAPAARQFKSSGDLTIDAAVREAGCWCLDHYKAKGKKDELGALLATYREGSFAHQCAKANLAAAETELNRYL